MIVFYESFDPACTESILLLSTCLSGRSSVLSTFAGSALRWCFLSAAWLPRPLRQHGVVLRVHRGPRRSHSADSRSYRFSSPLTRTDVALWSGGEQRGPWDRPNKSNLIPGWCVQACLRPPDNGPGQQGPRLQLLCVPRKGPACCSWGGGHVNDGTRGRVVFLWLQVDRCCFSAQLLQVRPGSPSSTQCLHVRLQEEASCEKG